MDRKKFIQTIIDDLNRRKRSIDALRLLLEDDDPKTALVMSERLRADLDGIVEKLRVIEEHPELMEAIPEAVVPAGAPAEQRPPESREVPVGYLGDDQSASGFEKWVNTVVDGFWKMLTHPAIPLKAIYTRKSILIFLTALSLALYSGWNAYETAYLSQHGLIGEYYLDENFGTLFKKRPDPSVNFRWLRGKPMPGFRSEHFSVRWTGYVKATDNGLHEFYTISDDGVRLWIDEQQLIDDWGIHGGTLDKGKISLTPGYHRVRLEYYQGEGDSVIKLQWKRPSDSSKSTISPRFLFPLIPEG